MQSLCLDPFNQRAFLNHFIELISGMVPTSGFSTADTQCDPLRAWLADASGSGFIQHSWEPIPCWRPHSSISISKGIFCQWNRVSVSRALILRYLSSHISHWCYGMRSLLAGFGWDHFCTCGAHRTTFFSLCHLKKELSYSFGTFLCLDKSQKSHHFIPSSNITLRLSGFSELSLYGTDCSILPSL